MRIRKFNEDIKTLDTEYIKNCFIEHFDEGKAELFKDGPNFCAIEIILPEKPENYGEIDINVDEHIEYYELMKEFYIELKTNKDKVNIKYPNINIELSRNQDYSLEIRFTDI